MNHQENQYYPPMSYSNYPNIQTYGSTDNQKVISLDLNNPAVRTDIEMLRS